jgi:hypothetical protein
LYFRINVEQFLRSEVDEARKLKKIWINIEQHRTVLEMNRRRVLDLWINVEQFQL